MAAVVVALNRSEIVRLDAVAELQPFFHGDYRVILDDGTGLTWSRRYRARFRDLDGSIDPIEHLGRGFDLP